MFGNFVHPHSDFHITYTYFRSTKSQKDIENKDVKAQIGHRLLNLKCSQPNGQIMNYKISFTLSKRKLILLARLFSIIRLKASAQTALLPRNSQWSMEIMR